jgi:hypothetical protein
MTCKCGSIRMIKINAKCNDLAFIEIPHLKADHDGYIPYLGIIGGDYLDLTICLDCGQIQNWEPIPDTEIKDNDSLSHCFENPSDISEFDDYFNNEPTNT